MFRASDIFGRRAGANADRPTVQVKRSSDGGPVNRVWDPATGKFVEEDVPSDIQALMGIQKRAKVEAPHEQDLQRAWQSSGPPKPPKVLSAATVGLGMRGKVPVAQQRGLGPGGEVDRTAPSVEYRGFSKVDLDDRYYERPTVVVHSRPTYWSSDGQFFIYWQGEVQRWSICDAASFAAVKAGQLPGWAYKEDHRHLCQANGWMEAWNGEWRSPDLEVTFRTGSHHKPQWEDPIVQKSVTTVEFHGFAMKELNTRYFLREKDIIQGRPSYWDSSGVYFIYWQESMARWAICDLKCLEAVREGQCPGWAYRADSGHFANACGWTETRSGEWVTAVLESAVISSCTRGLKVRFNGFRKAELNAQFTERSDEEVQGKPTFWDTSGTYFIYWQQSHKRWALCDNISLKLAQSGLAPGWAYRKDSQHFTKASSWMEVWGRDWVQTTAVCTLLEGQVKEDTPAPVVKDEVMEDASGTQLSRQQYRGLVKKVYEMKNPSKLPALEAIFEKYSEREAELFAQVCEKYSVDADEVAAQAEHNAQEVQEGAALSAGTAKQEGGQDEGEDPYAHLESAECPDLKASEYAVLIQSVYERYNPQKLKDMAALLKKFKANERDLYLQVCTKYDVHPAKFHARHEDEQSAEGQMAEPA